MRTIGPGAQASGRRAGGLAEAARLHWREDASERTLRRDGRRWTAWTVWVVVDLRASPACC